MIKGKRKALMRITLILMMVFVFSYPLKARAATGDDLVNYALSTCIGVPYVSPGRTTSGFDCCGLVWYVCNHFGINIGSGNQNTQRNYGTEVPFSKSSYSAAISNMRKGDLVFFDYGNDGYSDHVGLYSGNGNVIQAQTYGYLSSNINLNTTWLNGKKEWEFICSVRRVAGSVPAPPSPSVSLTVAPTIAKTTMNIGETCIVGGTVSSTGYNIASVTAGVYRNADGSGGAVNGIEATRRPNSTYFNISNVDPVLYFQNIGQGGTYYFVVKASLTDGTTRSASKQFTVRGNQCGQPTISPTDIMGGKHVNISGGSADTIHYTIYRNNEKIEQNHFAGSGGFSKDYTTAGTYRIEAQAARAGYTDSNVARIDFTISQVAAPKFAQAANSTSMVINLASDTSGASIYYTTSGNNPSTSSSQFSGALTFSEQKTIKAIAVKKGMANSEVTSYTVKVEEPDTPSGLKLTGESIIAEGDAVSLKWNPVQLAGGYTVTLYQDGRKVSSTSTTGTSATVILPVAGDYVINVYATNFVGNSTETDEAVSAKAMAPSTVRFTDWDGSVIKKQTVPYGKSASLPADPERRGYTFLYWNNVDKITSVKEDLEITPEYKINTYTVRFYNAKGNQVGPAQKVKFMEAATSPEDELDDIPTGYIFGGWQVTQSSDDSAGDYTAVDCDMKLQAVYIWPDNELPIYLEIISARQNEKSKNYNVVVKLTNYPEDMTTALLRVSLLTSEGMMVKSVKTEFEVSQDGNTTKSVTMKYSGIATKATAVVLGINGDDLTGSAYCAETTADVSVKTDEVWTDWSDTIPSNPDGGEIESKTEYRYATKSTTTSNSPSMSGWTQAGSSVQYGGWGAWSRWERGSMGSSDTVEVESRTLYGYYYFQCPICGAHMHGWPGCYTWAGGCGNRSISLSNGVTVFDPTPWGAANYYDFHGTGKYATDNFPQYGRVFLWSDNGVNNWPGYRYRTRTKTVNYTYYKWNDWSPWGETVYTANDNRKVETRTLYRQLVSKYSPIAGDEEPKGTVYHISGALSSIDLDLSGKLATVMVYKGKNTDPNEDQIQFVGQTTLGDGNTYDFDVIPKTDPTPATGDFTVCLGVQGSTGLINVDLIRYKRNIYTVEYVDDDGTILSTQEVEEGGNAEVPESPVKAGSYFTGWSENAINVQSNMSIAAQYTPIDYVVIYVDGPNDLVSYASHHYGEELTPPEDPSAVGREFVGWDAIMDGTTTVTENMVVNAVYKAQIYTVEFVDDQDTVVSSQRVAYGEAAIPPEELEVSDREFLGWSTETKWWFVTEDMTVKPVFTFLQTVDAPSYYTVPSDNFVALYLETATDGAEIHYTLDGTSPDENSELYDGSAVILDDFNIVETVDEVTNVITLHRTARVKAIAVKEEMNDSPVQEILYSDAITHQLGVTEATITLEVNGGDVLDESTKTVGIGDEYGDLPIPTYYGYDFIGWYTGAEDGLQIEAEDTCLKDITLYAHWEKNEDVHVHTIVIDEAVEATCQQEGLTEGRHCSECGEVLVEQKVIPKTGHKWDAGETVEEATCAGSGERIYTCTVCGETKTETIEATGHTPEEAEAIEPTCTEPGRTAGTYCLTCGETLEGMEEIPANGHTFGEWTTVKAATCKDHGLEEHTCSVCGEKETRETALVDHVIAVRGASDATCQQDGYTGDTYCTVCGEVLETGEAIPKLEHSWDEGTVLTASTCQSKGITRYTCSVCGEKRYEELPLGNHVGGKATCHDRAICVVCGEEYGELNPERHAGGIEVRNQVDATFTDEGYTGDTYCKGCGNLTKAGEIIPVLPPENERSIRVQNTSGMVGKDVVIPVTIEKNSGIAGFSFDILYDENILTLKSVTAGSVLSTGQVYTNGNVVNWYTTDNIMENGEILLLTFTIAEEAEAGVTQVRVEPHDGKKNLVDEDGNYVDVNYQTGKLDVQRGILGDVNGDTDITIADVVLLNRCVLGKQELSPENLSYADVNGDFDITIGDVVLLNRHVLGKESLSSAIEYLSMMEDYLGGGGYAVIRVEDVLVKPGATVGVPVYIEDNTGIAGMALSVTLPKGVTLNSITRGSLLSSGSFQYNGDSCTWYSSEGVFGDGLLMTLNITADEEAYSGKIAVGARDNDVNNLTDEHGGTMAIDYISGSLAIDYDELCETNGHNAGDAVIENEVEATCQGGSYDLVVYCTECHEEISRETVTLPAVDHQWDDEYSVDVPATCTEEGTESIHCSVCGTVKEGTERTIEKTPHDFGDWVTVNGASCTEAGLEKKVCSTCGTEETREIPATGHTMNKVDAVAETCEADGNIAYWHCSVCMKDFLNEDGTEELTAEQIILPATGHTWGRGIITKEATAEEDGEKTFTCEVCGKTKIESYSYVGETVVHARAFADNENLKDITIGASVVKIEDEAFAGCSNLKEIYFEGDLPELGQDVFRDIDPDAVIYYPDGNETWTQQALQEAGINLQTAAWNPSTGSVVIKDLADCTVTLEYQQTTYDSTSKQPSVTVKAGQMELKSGKDYTVTYGENVNAGTGTVDVSGQGNYTGSVQVTFLIAKAQGKIILTETAKTVNVGDAGFNLQVKEVVTDGEVSYSSSDPSVATIDPVSGSVQILAEGTTNLTATANGVNYTNESATMVLTVKGASVPKADNAITASNKTVKGTGRAQSVALKASALGGARLSYKSDRSNVKVTGNGVLSVPATFAGRVKVTITAAETDKYKPASKTVSIIVLPSVTNLTKVKASGSRKAKVTWKKNVTAQGYELQCATNKAFTKNLKTVTISKQSTAKKTVKKLKGGKKCFFRIRSYITIDGRKYYSDWSKVKKAKIKK